MAKIVGLTFTEAPANVCPHCGKAYKTLEALAKHIKDKHPGVGGGDNADGNTAPAKEE